MNKYAVEAPLHVIDNNPWQTRLVDPAHAAKLAQSIKKDGLLQRPNGRIIEANGDVFDIESFVAAYDDDGFLTEHDRRIQLAVGHHRVAAYRLLAEEEPAQYGMIAIDVAVFDDEQMADLAMLENDVRKDLSDIERARALKARKDDFGWTTTELGQRYGLSQSMVSNLLRLLELPEQAQQAVCDHDIPARTAIALASAYGLPETVREAIEPDTLLDAAIEGTSGDKIREKLRRRVQAHTVSLDDELFPLNHPFEKLAEAGEVVSAACSKCPVLLRQGRGGTEKRCPNPSCRDTKRNAWRRQQEAGQDEDAPGDRGYANDSTMDEASDTETSFVSKYREGAGDRLPLVGEEEQALSIDVDEQIIEPAVEALITELAVLNPKTLVVLYYKMQYGRPIEDGEWTREEILRAIAKKLVDYELPYEARFQPSVALQAVSRLLKQAGAELPWKSPEQEV